MDAITSISSLFLVPHAIPLLYCLRTNMKPGQLHRATACDRRTHYLVSFATVSEAPVMAFSGEQQLHSRWGPGCKGPWLFPTPQGLRYTLISLSLNWFRHTAAVLVVRAVKCYIILAARTGSESRRAFLEFACNDARAFSRDGQLASS